MPSPRFRAVVTDADYPDLAQERAILEAVGAELIREQARSEEDLIRVVRGADVVLNQYARLTAPVIDALDRCKGIVRYGVGFENVDLEAGMCRGIVVCNVPDYGTDEVSDHAITLLLAAARKLIVLAQGVQQGVWSVEPIPPDDPLLGLENCLITPHAAWYSDESAAALQRLAGEEAARLLLGQPPRCPVNRV